ncbi:MAG: SHOCT domain-containing protein [Desulfobacteraceae bacterium]|nr:SHOCT domain-containing protein [Desulfobacteraceae bacterium]
MNAKKNVAIIAIVLSVLGLAAMLFYRTLEPGAGYGYGYGGHMMPGMGGWSAWGMGGTMIIFWGLILFGLVLMINWLLTANRNERNADNGSGDALEILKNRYARGEIDREQYRQMREELSR